MGLSARAEKNLRAQLAAAERQLEVQAEVIQAAEALVNSFCSGLDGVGPCDRRCSGWITCYTLKQLRAAVDKMRKSADSLAPGSAESAANPKLDP